MYDWQYLNVMFAIEAHYSGKENKRYDSLKNLAAAFT